MINIEDLDKLGYYRDAIYSKWRPDYGFWIDGSQALHSPNRFYFRYLTETQEATVQVSKNTYGDFSSVLVIKTSDMESIKQLIAHFKKLQFIMQKLSND